jgi:hypothetical protein
MRQGKNIDTALQDMEDSVEAEMERYRKALEQK